MKFSFITFCLFAIYFVAADPSLLMAQSSVNEISQEELRGYLGRNIVPTNRSVETIGSPYLYEEFSRGILTLDNERETEPLLINFNAYQNRIEFQDGGDIIAVPGDRVRNFTFMTDDKQIHFEKGYSARGLDENEFVQVMSEGAITFLRKYEVSFQENIASYGNATQKDEYISNERFYVVVNGEIDRIRRLNERTITRIPDSYKSEMEAFKSEFKPDLSTAEGVAHYFNHYNQLVLDNN